jgi:hypothetical protein
MSVSNAVPYEILDGLECLVRLALPIVKLPAVAAELNLAGEGRVA